MVRSMTGYGRSEVEGEAIAVSVEARSLNHRHLDIALKLPRALLALEAEARRLIQEKIHRGRLDVAVGVTSVATHRTGQVKVDTALAREYFERANALADMLKIAGTPELMWLLEQPGVVTVGEPPPVAPEKEWPLLAQALTEAMAKLVAQREAEGQAILEEVMALHAELVGEVGRMAARVPEALARHQTRLRERLRALLGEVTLDEGRLAMEVALWAEKTDISEELARLKAHLEQSLKLLREGGSIGRTLDFLIQEMNREVNTVASKADDLDLSQAAISAKGILEKLREQIQNLE
jgi:uncharacterized protein (TIGR00255 family)